MVLIRRLLVPLAALGVVLATAAPAVASNDTYFEHQWNLAQLKAPDAWTASTGSGVTIGIVDTGVDIHHPDLAGKIQATADCVNGPCRDGEGQDGHGHGTLVAGIAAAVTDNGKGVAGVAPGARLVVAKAIDNQGKGSVEDINNAIRWTVDQGAKVVNLSLGDPNFLLVTLLGTPLRPGIEYAWSKGAVPVLASGNENVGLLDLGSANYGGLNAMVVGATQRSGGAASYSSAIGNAKWGLAAPGGSGDGPGEDILSTYLDGRYAWVAGTSMAAPHVSAGVAMVLAQGLSPTAAVQRILSTLDTSVKCGAGCQGRMDIAAAVGGHPGSGSSPGTSPPSASPSSTPGGSSVPRTVALDSTTTTTPPGPPDTGGGVTGPGGPLSGDRRTLAAGRFFEASSDSDAPSPAVLALAFVLAATSASAVGVVGVRRLRAGEQW